MKVKFYKESSKTNDFLFFPNILYFNEDNILKNETQKYDFKDKEFMQNYFLLIENIKKDLLNYTTIIEKFFSKSNPFSKMNIPDLIINKTTLDGDLSIYGQDGLFDKMKKLSDEELIKEAITIILADKVYFESESLDEFFLYDLKEEIDDILKDSDKILKLVNDSSLDSETKWNFMIFYNNPKKYLREYMELMDDIYPIFLNYYRQFEDDIIKLGKEFEEIIKEEGSIAIDSLTHSAFDISILETTDFLRILVSFTLPNSIGFSEVLKVDGEIKENNVNTITWGLNTKEISSLIKKKRENEIEHRVNIFKSLGDRTRYEVLRLVSKGVTANKELAKITNVSTATISYHINSLVDSDILVLKRVNNKLTHVINYDVLENLIKDFKKDLKIRNRE